MIFYFWPEEPAAPVLTSPADSLRDSRYGPRRGRTQQAGAAPHGLGADAPQEDHYSGLAAPPSEMCRRKIGDDAAVKASLRVEPVNPHADVRGAECRPGWQPLMDTTGTLRHARWEVVHAAQERHELLLGLQRIQVRGELGLTR